MTINSWAHRREKPQRIRPGYFSLHVRVILIILGSSAWGEFKSLSIQTTLIETMALIQYKYVILPV